MKKGGGGRGREGGREGESEEGRGREGGREGQKGREKEKGKDRQMDARKREGQRDLRFSLQPYLVSHRSHDICNLIRTYIVPSITNGVISITVWALFFLSEGHNM